MKFNGPIDEQEMARLRETLNIRDILVMQDALDWREADDTVSEDPDQRPRTAMVFAMLLNRCLPERFKLSDTELLFKATHYDAMPKRVLLRELYRAWREAGVPRRRGHTFPSLHAGKHILNLLFEMIAKQGQGGH